MIKKIIFLAAAFAVTSYVYAAENNYYTCSNVGGIAEWTISIDLEKKKAAFFDNDIWTTVELAKINQLESIPTQMQYIFEGKDDHGQGQLRITFNQTTLQGFVTFGIGTTQIVTHSAEDGCTLSQDSYIY